MEKRVAIAGDSLDLSQQPNEPVPIEISDEHLEEIRIAAKAGFYLSLSSDPVRAVLTEMIDHPWFMGISEPPVLGIIGALLRTIQPRRVLQIGTHIGFSAIYFADLLLRNERPGQLVTVEPEALSNEAARGWASKAGVAGGITFVEGRSTDPAAGEQIQAQGPYDLIYLDSSHQYRGTLAELTLILAPDGWLAPHGLLLLHDVSELATQWDSTGEGGVRRAFQEWSALYGDTQYELVLEPPLWPGVCGLGWIMRRAAPKPMPEEVPSPAFQSMLLRQQTEIAQLQKRLRQLESNWFVRWFCGVSHRVKS
jgi:predicted O-methyltransferase YrrM